MSSRPAPGGPRRRASAAQCALLLGVLVQLAPLLFLGRPIGASDILSLYAPWAERGAPPPANPLLDDAATGLHPWMAALLSRRELLETPSVGLGAPGPLASVFGLLSPTTLLPFAILPRSLALTGMALLDLTLGFWAFYAWRRRRGDDEVPAAIGAAVWGFAPARAVSRTWPFAGLGILFPLLLLAIDVELSPVPTRPPAARRALLWAALALGLGLGGHPSLALMGVYVAAAWGASRLLFGRTAARPALAPGVLGAALALLALAPTLALSRAFVEQGEWARLRAPIAHAPPVPWRIALLLFDPFFYGSPADGTWRGLGWAGPDNLVELQAYAGLATLLLAPLALASARRREAAFWLAAAALAALTIAGGGPFAAAARALPGLAIVFLSRLRIVALFAFAALASLGAAALSRALGPRGRLAAASLLLFTVVDLSLADVRFDPHPARADAPPPQTPALEALRALAPGGGRRFLAFGDAVVPNLAFELGLEDVRAHLLFTGGVRRLLGRLDPGVYGRRGTFLTFEAGSFHPDPALLDLLGVTALVTPPGSGPPPGDFRAIHRGADADVYARPWTAPARVVAGDGASPAAAGRVVRFEADRTRWTIDVDSPARSTLLLGRTHLPLLEAATLDGTPAATRQDPRAEGLLALDVPAGPHRVAVRARLPRALAAASLAGALGLAALAASALRRRPDNVAAA